MSASESRRSPAWQVIVVLVGAPAFQALLFGVSPLDPATYLAVLLLLGGVASVAILLPARRATRLDPVNTLRAE